MISDTAGSLRLFRAFGIDVFVHWSWFILAWAVYHYSYFFDDKLWSLAIFVTLFGIVLLHEFGHALACRSVGGLANRIVLWPFGGIAFVRPPESPGAVLWTIAAGPLVNVLLVPVTLVLWAVVVGTTASFNMGALGGDVERVIVMVTMMNIALLVFNMLPIYPLDGGQIFQALLWFVVGRVQSLRVAAMTGLVLAIVGGLAALVLLHSLWLPLIAVFIGMQAVAGLRQARLLAEHEAWRM